MKYITTAFFVFITSLGLDAHALFLETATQGQAGKGHHVTIYYAEPDGERELVKDWWADVSAFELWLHLPDGTTHQLEVIPDLDHFTATFIPDDPGMYHLSISHTVNQIAGKTQYVFNASAHVQVGKTRTKSDWNLPIDQVVEIDHDARLKSKRDVSLHYQIQEKPAVNATLSVFSPAGWSKVVKTNSEGSASFIPEWKGTYWIEAIHKSEVSGKPYEHVVQIYTTQLRVR